MSHLLNLAIAAVSGSVVAWVLGIMAVILRGPVHKCPRCGIGRTRPSRRRDRDLLLPRFLSPRRCESCRKRFYTLVSVRYGWRLRPRPAYAPRKAA